MLSKFTVLCLSSNFVIYLVKLKLILLYNKVVKKMCEEFILKLRNLFRRHVDTLIGKKKKKRNGGHIE